MSIPQGEQIQNSNNIQKIIYYVEFRAYILRFSQKTLYIESLSNYNHNLQFVKEKLTPG